MSKAYDFLIECGVFFLSTTHEGGPAVRPFGAVMELDGVLYVSTANTKEVYSQLISNERIQIVALKPGTRDWIRIDARAIETHDLEEKQAMLDACPVLLKRFGTKECAYFALFKMMDMEAVIITNDGRIQL